MSQNFAPSEQWSLHPLLPILYPQHPSSSSFNTIFVLTELHPTMTAAPVALAATATRTMAVHRAEAHHASLHDCSVFELRDTGANHSFGSRIITHYESHVAAIKRSPASWLARRHYPQPAIRAPSLLLGLAPAVRWLRYGALAPAKANGCT